VTDSKGGVDVINDIAGQMLSRYVFPFTPGMPAYGDTNYKEVIPEVDGTAHPEDTTDVQVPGYLTLLVNDGAAQGKWVAA
jgi:hypothetical protein